MTRRRIVAAAIGCLIVAGVVGYIYWSPAQQQMQQQRGRRNANAQDVVPVLVAAASLADVPIYLDGVGTTKALNTVTLRTQVDGQLIRIAFREGQDVTRGFVVAEIDPRTYQAQLDQALAKKAQDEAQLANAQLDLDRYTRLVTSNSASKQQVDTARATVAQLTAQVKADQAAIDNAQTTLGFTKITSPLDGRTGIRQVDEGNIVRASDATGIVVITQLRPISVFFNLPQQQLPQVNKAFAQGPLAVEAMSIDGRAVVDRGKLEVIDNQIDQTTGTIRLKAEFPNPDLQLWPGQFINVRLLIETLKQVVVVPTAAVQRGPTGTFVFVVGADSTVAVRPVTVSFQDDTRAVIASGLQAQERAVTTGFVRLAAGTRVAVQSGDPQPPPQTSPQAQPDTPANPQATTRPDGTPRPQGAPKRDGENPDGKRKRRSENTPGTSQ